MGDGESSGLSHHRLIAGRSGFRTLAFEYGPTRAAAPFGTGQAAAAAAGAAIGTAPAGGEAKNNSARFAHGVRPVHAGDGRLYATRRLHGPSRLAPLMPGHEIGQWRVLADPDHA